MKSIHRVGPLRFRSGLALLFCALLCARTLGAERLWPAHLSFKQAGAAAGASPAVPASPELLVTFVAEADVPFIAESHGLAVVAPLHSDPDQYVLRAESADAAGRVLPLLRAHDSVRSAHLNLPSQHVTMAFVPDDPLFNSGNPAGFPGQWHLIYAARPEFDSNVEGAWNRDLSGAGVTLGVADDGVETAHPDLAPNYVAADSFDFAENNADPNPVRNGAGPEGDNHGTSVAGVAAARGGNAVGVTGAAPFAKIAGLRLPFGGGGMVAQFVDATKYRSFGANRTIKVKNHSYGIGSPFVENRAEREAYSDSADAGTIHCVSAGNERGKPGEDSNKKDAQASPDILTVAAFGSSGQFASYSCYGANVVVTASSSSFRAGEFGVTTTDRTGNVGYNSASDDNSYPDTSYTADFGGTSSAAPLVAGIMALGVHANPNLNVRMAKHLLVRSSDVVDPNDASETSDGGWKVNGAGIRFNQNYGFGLIDADEFTRLATEFSGVTPLEVATGSLTAVGAAVPDQGEISRTFSITATTPLEEIEIFLNISHTFRGDLEGYLTSPRGTTSRLFIRNGANDPNNRGGIDWWFTSNAFWGENPSGTWTLVVRDRFQGDTGTWNSFQYRARMGQLISANTPQPPTITAIAPASGPVGAMVTIQGTKLTDASAVTFNGVAATFTVPSATQISATVPAGASTGLVRVTTPAGTATSAGTFTVTAAPAIGGFSPPSGVIGSTVIITGTHFTAPITVKFNGVTAPATLNSASQITATVPTGATSGRITVMTPAGEATSATPFAVSAAPTIAGFTPAAAPAGGSVTINGANLAGATAVRFNGATAQTPAISSDQITAIVPPGATSGPISVTTPAGTGQSATDFILIPPPVIGNFTPLNGAPGNAVVISGTALDGATQVSFNGVAATAFTVDSPSQITALVPSAATSGPIRVTTPAGIAISTAGFTVLAVPGNDSFAGAQNISGAAGTANSSNVGATREAGEPIHAGNPGGRSVWFQWTAPANGSWVFETLGSGFDTVLAIYTGAAVSTLTPVVSNDDSGGQTHSAVTLNAAAGTNYRIAVDGSNADPTNPTGAQSGSVRLGWSAITAPPLVAGFAPASGAVGARVAIRGQHFAGATSVSFGGVNAPNFSTISTTEISATVPPGAVTGLVGVTTPGGSANSPTMFTVATAPGNDLFASSQTITGNAGTIAGSNLGAGKETGEPDHGGNSGGRSVWFDWTAPSAGQWTFDTSGSAFDTLIGVYTGTSLGNLAVVAGNDDVPEFPGGPSRVTFTVAAGSVYRIAVDGYGGLSGSLTLNWAFTPTAPVIAGFNPPSGPVASSVVISGQNLSGATAAYFGGVTAVFTVDSPSQLTAIVPAGAPSGPIRVLTPNGAAVSTSSFTVTGGAANDLFAGATVLAGNAAIVAASSAGATKEAGEPNHAGDPGGRSLWFRWSAPATGSWTIDTAGSRFDTILAVYTGPAVGNLTEVGANDDASGVLTSGLQISTTAGTVYHIAVDGYGGDAGALVLRLFPALIPTVIYSTGFEAAEGFSTTAPLAGSGGWNRLGSGGNGIVDGYFLGSGQQALIGLLPPDLEDDQLFVWPVLNHTPNTNTLPIVRFTTSMAIIDSLNNLYDGFHWSVFNRDGDRLCELTFDNSNLEILYRLNDGFGYVDTGVSFENERIYRLEILMDFARNTWRGTLDGALLAGELPISVADVPRNLGDIDAVWSVGIPGFPGDNFMLFDDYRVTAEVSPKPEIVLQPQDRSTLAGAEVTFGVVARGEQVLQYQWRFNGDDIPGATNALLELRRVLPIQAGGYSVVISNDFGFATSAVADLAVNQPMPPTLAAGTLSPVTGFSFTVNGTPGVQYAIEASTNLTDWMELASPASPNGTFTVSDPAAVGVSRRFYRARASQ